MNCIFMLPARGGAIELNPGMNLATSSVARPRLKNDLAARRMHVSGSTATRQRKANTSDESRISWEIQVIDDIDDQRGMLHFAKDGCRFLLTFGVFFQIFVNDVALVT